MKFEIFQRNLFRTFVVITAYFLKSILFIAVIWHSLCIFKWLFWKSIFMDLNIFKHFQSCSRKFFKGRFKDFENEDMLEEYFYKAFRPLIAYFYFLWIFRAVIAEFQIIFKEFPQLLSSMDFYSDKCKNFIAAGFFF